MSRGGRIAAATALALLCLITLPVFAFIVITPKHYMASGSMTPSLHIDDYVAFLPLVLTGEPKSGDVIAFWVERPDIGRSLWISRIVAGPGDRISVKKGILRVNGSDATRREVDWPRGVEHLGDGIRAFEETDPNGRTFSVLDDPTQGFVDNVAEQLVPPGHYFVMGDNRDNALDSRSKQLGLIPRSDITAKAGIIYFAYDRTGIRFDRIGTVVR